MQIQTNQLLLLYTCFLLHFELLVSIISQLNCQIVLTEKHKTGRSWETLHYGSDSNREGLPACTSVTSWCCGPVTRSSLLPKQSGSSSHGQGFPDLTRQAGQEKYHHTILFMLDLIPNILTIPSVVKKS